MLPAGEDRRRAVADGGIFATSPDQVALHEAEHFIGLPGKRVRALSIGTGNERYRTVAEPTERTSGRGP